jgi:hypothetical protein
VRRASSILLDGSGLTDVQRAVALAGRHWKRTRADPHDDAHWIDARLARDIARSAEDLLLELWVTSTASAQLLATQRADEALEWARQAEDILRADAIPAYGPFAASQAWMRKVGEEEAGAVVRYYGWAAIRKAYRYTGDLEGWERAVENGEVVSRPVLQSRPTLYLAALVGRFEKERNLGDQADLSALERMRDGSLEIEGKYLSQLGHNASARGDRNAAVIAHTDKVRFVVERRYPELVGHSPEDLTLYFQSLPESERRSANSIANASYEIAVNLIEAGRVERPGADRRKAIEWLRLSGAIWRDWGTNGSRAVKYRSAVLEIRRSPGRVRDLLEVAHNAPRPGLRVNAIRKAIELGTTRRREVQDTLDSMIAETFSTTQRAALLSARAWATRPNEPTYRASCLSDAEEALRLFETRPASYLPSIARAAATIAAVGRMTTNQAVERRGIWENLMAIGRLLLNATTPEQLLYLARTWSSDIRGALAYAVENDDAEIADLTAEIVRRDGIGPLLADVAVAPWTPSEAAGMAIRLNVAGTKDGEVLTQGSDVLSSSESEEGGDERISRAADPLLFKRDEEVYEQAKLVLGQLGSLADPATLYAARASAVLTAANRTARTFILQLLPSYLPMIGAEGSIALYRRLTWNSPAGVEELVDAVPMPEGLDEDATLRRVDSAGLFPEPLLSELRQSGRAEPIRLLIVATGLYHIAFDAVTVGPDYLLELAITSVHTSLTAAHHALTHPPMMHGTGSLAVLDSARLTSTSWERTALEEIFPELKRAGSSAELRSLLEHGQRYAVFALGVHGVDDSNGWGQAKVMPNDDVFYAAEAFGYSYPDVCVMASCFSNIRVQGTDQAGFPVVFFARGARTVIGAIGELPDDSTSSILCLFYEELGTSGNPVAAMRVARLKWIDRYPETRRDDIESWARLVSFGGAHC